MSFSKKLLTMYFEEYQADSEIFEGIPTLDLGPQFVLRPINPSQFEYEIKEYVENCNDEEIRQFLPKHYADTEQLAKKILHEFLDRMIFRAAILFCVALREKKATLGYVMLNSPKAVILEKTNQPAEWTMDFWASKKIRGMGIMYAAIHKCMWYMQKMQVPFVFAYVDKTNLKTIRLMENLKFTLMGENPDKTMYKFGVRLKR
jgi:RimJ/RimL family protein N-acetyltransferase